MNKWVKRIGFLLFFFVLGALLGFFGVKLSDVLIDGNVFMKLSEYINQNIVYIQLVVSGFIFLPVMFLYINVRGIVKKIDVEVDDDPVFEKFDKLLDRTVIINGINIILANVLFGFAATGSNDLLMYSVVVFLAFIGVSVFVEVSLINLYKNIDETKSGDPMSMKFHKDWLKSCDEAEQLLVYKAGYKTFRFMQTFLMIFMGPLIVIKISFDTSNSAIITVGLIAIMNIILFTYYSHKGLNKE
jgi:hypothetical protein